MVARLIRMANMLQIHLLLQLYDLSDPAKEDALIEAQTKCHFGGFDKISDRILDETTILALWNLLEKSTVSVTDL